MIYNGFKLPRYKVFTPCVSAGVPTGMNSVDEIIHNLKTIGCITAGDKISTAKKFITVDNRAGQSLWRTISADSRERSIRAVCREVRLAITILGLLQESSRLSPIEPVVDPPDEIVLIPADVSSRTSQLRELYAALSASQSGISALCTTYGDDQDAGGELGPLHNEIATALSAALTVMLSLGIPRAGCSGASWNIPRI